MKGRCELASPVLPGLPCCAWHLELALCLLDALLHVQRPAGAPICEHLQAQNVQALAECVRPSFQHVATKPTVYQAMVGITCMSPNCDAL